MGKAHTSAGRAMSCKKLQSLLDKDILFSYPLCYVKEKKKSWHDYYCKLLDLLKHSQTRQEKKCFHRWKLDQCLAWKICFYNFHCTILQECLLMAMETDPYSRKLLWGIKYPACSLVPSLPWQACQLCGQVPHSSERENLLIVSSLCVWSARFFYPFALMKSTSFFLSCLAKPWMWLLTRP